MFVHTSALVAMMSDESEAAELAARLERHSERRTSPVVVFETAAAIARSLGLSPREAHRAVRSFLKLMDIDCLPLEPEICEGAIEAYARYGKGQGQAAGLTMSDCFAYAAARQNGEPLLYKGLRFARTDIPPG